MADSGRPAGLPRLLHRGTALLRDNRRNSIRVPIVEVRGVLAMAVRDGRGGREQRRRLPQHIYECGLDSAGMVGNRGDAPCLWTNLLHHDRRDPVRPPAFQDGVPLAAAFREDIPEGLKHNLTYSLAVIPQDSWQNFRIFFVHRCGNQAL